MPPNSEPNLGGNLSGLGGQKTPQATMPQMSPSTGGVNLSSIDRLAKSLQSVLSLYKQLKEAHASFMRTASTSDMASQAKLPTGGGKSTSGGSLGPATVRTVLPAYGGSGGGGSGSGGGGGMGVTSSTPAPRSYGGTIAAAANIASSPNATDSTVSSGVGKALGTTVSGAMDDVNPTSGGIGKILSMNPISLALKGIERIGQLYGAIASGGMQYAYNRIEGPTGNREATLQASNVLRSNATFMGMDMQKMFAGLTQKSPAQGTYSDILGTVQAGQAVGAFMNGTPQRNGFFQGVREMQGMTPGVGAGQLATGLAGYIGNTKSQQTGMYLGGGAFTMIGQGGRYKSVGEWAEGITKFLQEQRPGGDRGKTFTKDELLTQNFPGSNVNAWFEMMGVPANMVDYWWQYVMTKAQAPTTDGPFDVAAASKKQRGLDIGQERLRNVTQSSRRDIAMGSQMYPMYAIREAADRRFNEVMMGADAQLGQMGRTSNVGAAMSLLPTAISDMLFPILQAYASSPAGAVGSLVGHVFGHDLTKEDVTPPGDPIGDWGGYGGTSTSHLSPDLARKIQAMQKANPRLKVTSGMRDTVTQNRLHAAGVGRVGPASHSQHTRGWAADIGPRSQMGWLQQNAHKYGLQTAGHMGEPWHVQSSGTLPQRYGNGGRGLGDVGDPMIGDLGEWFGNVVHGAGSILGSLGSTGALGIGGLAASKIMGESGGLLGGGDTGAAGLFEQVIKKFLGGGNFQEMVDQAMSLYTKLLTTPMAGLAKLFGNNNFAGNLQGGELDRFINQKSSVSVDLSSYAGFTPATNPALAGGGDIFGDPIGDLPGRIMAQRMGNHRTVLFQNTFVVGAMPSGSGQTGGSMADSRRVAGQLAGHLETQLAAAAGRQE